MSAPKPQAPRRPKIKSWLKTKLGQWLPTKDQFHHLPKLLSKKERYLILALFLTAFVSFLSLFVTSYYHFTHPVPDFGGSFSEGMVGAPKTINPLLAQTNDVDRDLASLIYIGLMKYDGQGQLGYGLAKSYEVSGDGLTYTFQLRSGLKWHNGQSLNADDVVFTILTAQNTDYGSLQRINWQGVDVSKTDDQTVIFKLKNKYAQFLSNTTLGILPKHIWSNVKPSSFGLYETNLKPIGAGPYKFSKIRRDSAGNVAAFEVTAFPDYFDGKPYISGITFKFFPSEDKMINAYNNNEIQGLSFISPTKIGSLRFLGRLKISRLKLPRYFALFFNQTQSKALSDKNVRLALNYATDKKAILEKILDGGGSIVDSPLLAGIIDIKNPGPSYGFDLDKAKKTLDDAGWRYSETDKVRIKASPTSAKKTKSSKEKPAEPAKLTIKLTTSNWPELVSVARQIQVEWQAAGAKVDLEILSLPELQQAIKERNYEVLLFGEVLSLDPDPFSFWHSSQKRDPGLNLALFDNKEADKILEEARQTLDRGARFAKYGTFEELVAKDLPAIFLYSPDYLYPQPKKIKNSDAKIISVPSERFDNISRWYIKTKRKFN